MNDPRRGSIKNRMRLIHKVINKTVLGFNKICYQVKYHHKIKVQIMKLWILFILVLTFIPQSITPQSNDVTISLGGKIMYNTSKTNLNDYYQSSTEITKYSFSPRFGYFLSENMQFGIGLQYDKSIDERKSENIEDEYSTTLSLFSITPSLRYYQNIKEKFGFYGELEVAIGSGTNKLVVWDWQNKKRENTYEENQITISLNPGIYYKVTNNFRLEVSVGGMYYSNTKTKHSTPENSGIPTNEGDDFGIELSFESLSLGVVYVF